MWGYITYPWTTITEWLHSQPTAIQTQQLTAIELLRKQLQACNYPRQIQEKICMYFAQLKSSYPQINFISSTQQPIEIIYKDMVVSIIGDIKINTLNIKCKLTLTICFINKNIDNFEPIFFVRNPLGNSIIPNQKFKQLYEWVIGGVKIKQYSGNILWNKYHKDNLKNAIKGIIEQLQKYFPFVKDNKKLLNSINESQFYKNELNSQQLLQNIQHLQILQKSILSQVLIIKDQILKIKQEIEKYQNTQEQIHLDKFIEPIDQQSQKILDSICQDEALRDCQRQLDNICMEKDKISQEFNKYLKIVENISEKRFWNKYRLNKILQHK